MHAGRHHAHVLTRIVDTRDLQAAKDLSFQDSTLRDDPGSDDERTVVNHASDQRGLQQDEQAIRLNGGISIEGDDGDMQDADIDDDMDDDMMDKISSSPSIEDGGCALPSPRDWPRRVDSLPSIRDCGC